MYDKRRNAKWSENYWNQIKRNIGLVSLSEQEEIRKKKIAILGVGGLGGPIAEQLIRVGCENITICDNDKFELTNLNRQLCMKEDIGHNKIDVIEKLLKRISHESNAYLNLGGSNYMGFSSIILRKNK